MESHALESVRSSFDATHDFLRPKLSAKLSI